MNKIYYGTEHGFVITPSDSYYGSNKDLPEKLDYGSRRIEGVFHEYTRRIPPSELKKIEEECAIFNQDPSNKNTLLRCLNEGNLNDEIFNNKGWPFSLLQLVREGEITPLETALPLQFWEISHFAKSEIEIKFFPLFNAKGAENPEARNIIRDTLCDKGIGSPKTQPKLSEDEISLLFERAKKSTRKSEQVIIAFKKARSKPFERKILLKKILRLFGRNVQDNILQGIYQSGGDRSFHYATINGEEYRLITPGSLEQKALKLLFGEKAMDMNVVLGLSTPEDIRYNALLGARDCFVHFPGVEAPEEADGYKTKKGTALFTRHDLYHTHRGSSCPKEMATDLTEEFCRVLDDVRRKHPSAQDAYEGILDREFTEFVEKAKYIKSAAGLLDKYPMVYFHWLCSVMQLKLSKVDRKVSDAVIEALASHFAKLAASSRYGFNENTLTRATFMQILTNEKDEFSIGIQIFNAFERLYPIAKRERRFRLIPKLAQIKMAGDTQAPATTLRLINEFLLSKNKSANSGEGQ